MHPFWIGMIIMIVSFLPQAYYIFSFSSNLKSKHKDLYEKIHSPNLLDLLKRTYAAEGTKESIAFCDRYRTKILLAYFLDISGVFIFLFIIIKFGVPS